MVLCGGLEAGGAESGLANWLAQYQWTLHGEKAEVVREPENGDFRIRSSASAGAAVLKSELIPLQGVSERQINAKFRLNASAGGGIPNSTPIHSCGATCWKLPPHSTATLPPC